MRAAKAEQKTAGDNAAAEHDKLVAGRRDLERGGEALVVAISELFTQAAVFAPYAHGDLRPLLGVTETAPWPGASSWPDPGQAAAALADQIPPDESGTVESYHGDFDWPGVAITAKIIDRYGARPWRMTAGDYLSGVKAGGTAVALAGDPVPTPWEPGLREAMRATGRAIYEETVADQLLEDLRKAHG